MPEATGDRLARLLAMVTYLADRDGADVADLAEHFGVTQAQVLRDVDTLWVSGTPGYQPDDLLDFSADGYDERYIALTNARGMDRPLRLEPAEAVSLVVALRALRALPGMDGAAVESALAELTVAAGDAVVAEDALTVHAADEPLAEHVAAVLTTARQALRDRVRMRVRYASASDDITERLVEPIELTSDGDHWYLRGWCLRAGAMRHFRLDRILETELTDQSVERRRGAQTGSDVRPQETSMVATLTVTPRSRWVAERFNGRVRASGPDRIEVELDVADPAWLDRLVLQLGPDLLALAPQRYASVVAERARRALAHYESDSREDR